MKEREDFEAYSSSHVFTKHLKSTKHLLKTVKEQNMISVEKITMAHLYVLNIEQEKIFQDLENKKN